MNFKLKINKIKSKNNIKLGWPSPARRTPAERVYVGSNPTPSFSFYSLKEKLANKVILINKSW